MSKNLVVKDNKLINASYNLELVEQRILLMSIVKSRHQGNSINEFLPVVIHAQDYAEQFNIHIKSAYKVLKDAANTLFDRRFTYTELNKKGNIVNVKNRWVTQVKYADTEGEITLVFSPVVIPFLAELEKQFTCYDMEKIAALSTAHSIRIYELLISWRTTLEVRISLQELKFKLGLDSNMYPRIYDFKKKVLIPALQQISKETDISVSFKDVKKGRLVEGFIFNFKFKISQKTKALSHKKQSFEEWIQKNDLARAGESWNDAKKRLKKDFLIYKNG